MQTNRERCFSVGSKQSPSQHHAKSCAQKKVFFGVKRSFDTTSHFMTLQPDRKFKRFCEKLGVDTSCLRALKKKKTDM